MQTTHQPFEPGSLWERTIAAGRHALQSGAQTSIECRWEFIEDGGVQFVVRCVAGLRHKPGRTAGQRTTQNPFLPYDRDLYVADVSASHLCLLNKFNVFDHHLLVVTRRFVPQEALLDRDDFAALARCLGEIDGLGFYNAGAAAGASQGHKHLQIVPLPLAPSGPAVPMAPLLSSRDDRPTRCPELPFSHAYLPRGLTRPAERVLADYLALLAAVGLRPRRGRVRQAVAYNLLGTRDWMMLVPRRREHFDSISVNALGYAGSLLVREASQIEQIRSAGPMKVLAAVAGRG